MSTKDRTTVIDRLRARSKPENRRFVHKNVDIAQQVRAILKEKNMTQEDLARLLEKQPSEVSKLICGLHNLTLESITKMEAVLDADIILTPLKAQERYKPVITWTVYGRSNDLFGTEAATRRKAKPVQVSELPEMEPLSWAQ